MSSTSLPAPGVSRRDFLQLFGAVMLPMFMAAVDQTLLATATPAIAEGFGGLRDASWIAIAYLLASAACVPVYGRLGDRLGRRRMLLVALGVFTAGSLACGLAQSMGQLVAARALQGMGGAGLMTLAQALIGELVAPRERARFQGYFAAVFTLASVGGPVLGGIVVAHASWRWLFLANLPLAALAAWRLSLLPVPPAPVRSDGRTDLPGAALFAVSAVSLLFWLTSVGHRFAWVSPTSLALVAAVLAAGTLLLRHERRHPSPFLPLALLRMRAIQCSAVTTLLFAACMFAMVFFLPIYLQLGHQVSVANSGLLLLPLTGGIVVGSTLSGRIVARTGVPRPVPIVGMSLSSLALLGLGLLSAGPVLVGVLGFVAGLGFGTVMPTTQVVVQTVAGRERLGQATSIVALARSLGSAIGTAVFGAIAFALMADPGRATLAQAVDPQHAADVLHAFHVAFLLAALAAALAALSATMVPRVQLR